MEARSDASSATDRGRERVSAGVRRPAQRSTAGSGAGSSVGAPGAFPGRSANVGRSLEIEGVRALARANVSLLEI